MRAHLKSRTKGTLDSSTPNQEEKKVLYKKFKAFFTSSGQRVSSKSQQKLSFVTYPSFC